MHHNDFRLRILNEDDSESILHWYNNANIIFLNQVKIKTSFLWTVKMQKSSVMYWKQKYSQTFSSDQRQIVTTCLYRLLSLCSIFFYFNYHTGNFAREQKSYFLSTTIVKGLVLELNFQNEPKIIKRS